MWDGGVQRRSRLTSALDIHEHCVYVEHVMQPLKVFPCIFEAAVMWHSTSTKKANMNWDANRAGHEGSRFRLWPS